MVQFLLNDEVTSQLGCNLQALVVERDLIGKLFSLFADLRKKNLVTKEKKLEQSPLKLVDLVEMENEQGVLNLKQNDYRITKMLLDPYIINVFAN